jgi:hypothetical protein
MQIVDQSAFLLTVELETIVPLSRVRQRLNRVIINMKSKSTETKSSIKPERIIVMKKPYGVVTLIAVLMGAILLLQMA